MADGSCDVPGCRKETFMGWQPLTERLGRQICERHWLKQKDSNDDFDLFEAFGFRRPAGIQKPVAKLDVPQRTPEPDCGRTARLQPAVEPKKPDAKIIPATVRPSRCRACGAEREAGHTYCAECAEKRIKHLNRLRQKRHYQRVEKPNAFAPELSRPACDSLQGLFFCSA